jgi:Flp pilus assembly protein TadD
MRADVRGVAAAVVIITVAGLGAFFSGFPGTEPDPAARHAREATLREISERFTQGTMMLHARRYEHALAAFHRVLELDPMLPEAHVNAGFALVGLERFGAARDFFSGAIELRPGQLNAYYGLAVALEGLGDKAGARGAMRTYVHLAPREDPYRRKAEAALWEWEAAVVPRR